LRNTLTIIVLTILLTNFSSSNLVGAEDSNLPTPLFSLTLLKTGCCSLQIIDIAPWVVADSLPKIGIGAEVITHEHSTFRPRTYFHPRDDSTAHVDGNGNTVGAIPGYNDGGYDVVFFGFSGAIDYDPTSVYSNVQFSPDSYNIASYDNDEISELINQYTTELDPAERAKIAPQIQKFAYDDQPYIHLFNPVEFWVYDNAWTTLTRNDLLFFGTNNARDRWKDLKHDRVTELVYAYPFELVKFSPFVISSSHAFQHLNPIYSGLYERDIHNPYFAYAPVIAANLPTWNENKTIATIDINPDAKFSTGASVTAEDVVNSFHMHMTPAVVEAYKNRKGEYLYGGSYDALTRYISSNDSVHLIDSNTLEITLKEATFLANQLFSVPIVDMDEVGTPDNPKAYYYDFNIEPWKYHGAGPFMYNEGVHNNGIDQGSVKLIANQDYWRGTPKLDLIEFRQYGDWEKALKALVDGAVHIIDSEFYAKPKYVEGYENISFEAVSDFGTLMMVINMDHPIIGSGIDTPLGKEDPTRAEEAARYVRQAISHAIPREDILTNLSEFFSGYGEHATTGSTLWPELAVGYDSSLKPYEYNTSRAKELMEMAGYEIKTTSDGLPFDNLLPLAISSLILSGYVIKRKNKQRK
jgi:ABC-type transport system substrate-binding protein